LNWSRSWAFYDYFSLLLLLLLLLLFLSLLLLVLLVLLLIQQLGVLVLPSLTLLDEVSLGVRSLCFVALLLPLLPLLPLELFLSQCELACVCQHLGLLFAQRAQETLHLIFHFGMAYCCLCFLFSFLFCFLLLLLLLSLFLFLLFLFLFLSLVLRWTTVTAGGVDGEDGAHTFGLSALIQQ